MYIFKSLPFCVGVVSVGGEGGEDECEGVNLSLLAKMCGVLCVSLCHSLFDHVCSVPNLFIISEFF